MSPARKLLLFAVVLAVLFVAGRHSWRIFWGWPCLPEAIRTWAPLELLSFGLVATAADGACQILFRRWILAGRPLGWAWGLLSLGCSLALAFSAITLYGGYKANCSCGGDFGAEVDYLCYEAGAKFAILFELVIACGAWAMSRLAWAMFAGVFDLEREERG